jgi:hypothetical protein
MRNLILVLVAAAFVASGTSLVQAQPPIPDPSYSSTAGEILEGRSAHSWAGADRVNIGDVLNFASWDGAALATEWRFSCMTVVNAFVLGDTRVNGTGNVEWFITYAGGDFWLSGGGPWGAGDPDYPGTVETFIETRVIQYVNGVATGADSDFSGSGRFDNHQTSCLQLTSNDALIDDTGNGPKPADYPMFLDANCNMGPMSGRWGQTTDIVIGITGCAVPVEESSWGAVKALYQE